MKVVGLTVALQNIKANVSPDPFVYLLDTPFSTGHKFEANIVEKCLRKKYPPSSLGYEELISALKSATLHPVKI